MAGGLIAGALIGSTLAAPYYAPGYYPGPVYGVPAYGVPAYGPPPGDEIGYCMQRFKSYDPASGTYFGLRRLSTSLFRGAKMSPPAQSRQAHLLSAFDHGPYSEIDRI